MSGISTVTSPPDALYLRHMLDAIDRSGAYNWI
jgi:hypothetical protein